jgi:hypothetical protein
MYSSGGWKVSSPAPNFKDMLHLWQVLGLGVKEPPQEGFSQDLKAQALRVGQLSSLVTTHVLSAILALEPGLLRTLSTTFLLTAQAW